MSSDDSSIAPLRIRSFRVLWLASIVSNLGSFLQAVAAAWLMLELTGSAFWVGLMAASTTLPLLFLALYAGGLADIVDRRVIIVASQAVMGGAALAMAALDFFDAVTPGRLLALGLVLGVGVAFNLPAWQAMVPDLVPRGLVASAVALNSAAFNVARAVGPALGGLVVATAGPGLAFLLNAVSFTLVVGAVATFMGGADWSGGEGASLNNAVAIGIRYARFTAPFRWLLGTAAAFAVTSAVVQTLLPNVTEDTFGAGPATYGLLLGAMGAGALVGAFTRARMGARLGTRMVPASILGFGAAGVALGLAPSEFAAVPALLAAGVFWVWALATLNATTQLLAPAWVRGRVMSLYTLSFVGILPVGAILAGAVGDVMGASEATVVLSLGAALLGVTAFRLPIPSLTTVVSPEPSDEPLPIGEHARRVEGGPVMLVNIWVIGDEDLEAFLAAMDELRLVRLRTGAYRWTLYRNVADPHRMTEVFLLNSWEDHLRQHQRLDREAVQVIRTARAFDRDGGPVTHHLVAFDPEERPDWAHLTPDHDQMHAADGSIPIM